MSSIVSRTPWLWVAIALLAPTAAAQNWFGAPRVFQDPGQTLCHGDLDGDGDVDVLRFQFPNGVVPELNDGSGDFTSGTSFVLDAPTNAPFDTAALGDFDGNGTLDLAIGHQVGSIFGVAIHRGLGNALFAPSVFVPLQGSVSLQRIGDFNGDGRTDFVALSGSSTKNVEWVHWNGSLFQVTTASYALGGQPIYDLAVGDLDADGRDDVAFSDIASNQVRIVWSTPSGLSLGPSYSIGSSSSASVGVAFGDLDGDHDDDLLLVNRPSSGVNIQWRIVYDNGGVFVLSATQTIPSTGFSTFPIDAGEIELADVDGDGDLDIGGVTRLASQSSTGAWFTRIQNTGTGFAGFHVVPATQHGRAGGFADFDGDGHLDFLTNISIVFGDGTLTSPFQGGLPSGTSIQGAQIVDLEGDGDLDVLDTTTAALNDATGAFTTTGSLLPTPHAGFTYGADNVRGDFDGDGRIDLLTRYSKQGGLSGGTLIFLETRFLRDDHTGHLVDQGPAANSTVVLGSSDSLVADFDADGDLDVLGTLGLARNHGDGTFNAPVVHFPGTPTDARDVDADGDLDVLVLSGNQLILRRKQAGLNWTAEVVHQPTATKFQAAAAKFIDLDSDGDPDIAAPSVGLLYPSLTAAFVELLRNDAGAFTFVQSLAIANGSHESVGEGDVDGDGVPDLLLASEGGMVTALRRDSAVFGFAPARVYQTFGLSKFADVDSDRDVDIVGSSVLKNSSLGVADWGKIRQYGSGTVGKGGAIPVLGAQGPAAVASTSFELRLRHALGGSLTLLLFGPTATDAPGLPLLGMTLYVGIPFTTATLLASGPAGGAGEGEFTIAIPSLPSTIQGITVFAQSWHADPAAYFGASQSNGLELDFH